MKWSQFDYDDLYNRLRSSFFPTNRSLPTDTPMFVLAACADPCGFTPTFLCREGCELLFQVLRAYPDYDLLPYSGEARVFLGGRRIADRLREHLEGLGLAGGGLRQYFVQSLKEARTGLADWQISLLLGKATEPVKRFWPPSWKKRDQEKWIKNREFMRTEYAKLEQAYFSTARLHNQKDEPIGDITFPT